MDEKSIWLTFMASALAGYTMSIDVDDAEDEANTIAELSAELADIALQEFFARYPKRPRRPA